MDIGHPAERSCLLRIVEHYGILSGHGVNHSVGKAEEGVGSNPGLGGGAAVWGRAGLLHRAESKQLGVESNCYGVPGEEYILTASTK